MNGQMVNFPVNGSQAAGYLAEAQSGKGNGVLVLQEWWGLVPQIKGICDRLADQGSLHSLRICIMVNLHNIPKWIRQAS